MPTQRPHQKWQNAYHIAAHSLPVQLVLRHLRENQFLLAGWLLLWTFLTGLVGAGLGIPYLFLDPEYRGAVSGWSFAIVGAALSGFTMSFHITCYILDAHRYPFLAAIRHSFILFCLNNSLVPLGFLLYYLWAAASFQYQTTGGALGTTLWHVGCLLGGYIGNLALAIVYFQLTNQDVFRHIVQNVDVRLRKSPIQRVGVMARWQEAKQGRRSGVETFYVPPWYLYPAPFDALPDRSLLIRVFDQHQFNAVGIQFFAVSLLLLTGYFQEVEWVQIPAAASVLIMLSILVMIGGALVYWLKGWASSSVIGLLLVMLFIAFPQQSWIYPDHRASSLDYTERATYSLRRIRQLSSPELFRQDQALTTDILQRWKARAMAQGGTDKPLMVIVCASGGGLRASLWVMRAMQHADSLTGGALMRHTTLMTGSSGGLIGLAYYRELCLRYADGQVASPYDPAFLDKIARDKLNPVIVSLLADDIFPVSRKITVGGHPLYRDRGYALEQKLLADTDFLLDKSVAEYYQPERDARIPMMLIAPTIINDGRKLYISPQPISYMNAGTGTSGGDLQTAANDPSALKIKGIEFRRFFSQQNADNLRFVTALRMNATFPYISPALKLPSTPAMQIMDAGFSDNFGISDAVRFLFVFREWIQQNTSGVILVSVRDGEKEAEAERFENTSFLDQLFTPVNTVWRNMTKLQDISNDNSIEYAKNWYEGHLHLITLAYTAKKSSTFLLYPKASLNWRLTEKEKQHVISAILTKDNQAELSRLKAMLTIPDSAMLSEPSAIPVH